MYNELNLTNNSKQSMFKYKEQEIMAASPERLILYVYDHIIHCCAVKNSAGAIKGFAQLIDGLNYEYREIATGLLRIYDYCLRRLREEDYDEPYRIIKGLRESWDEGIKVKQNTINNKPMASVQGVLA